jgi:hypothetical protein
LSQFNPKAPPRKTEAFWAIVDANVAPEESELADIIDDLGKPKVLTIARLGRAHSITEDLTEWLNDRKNRRLIPGRLEKVGYHPVRNDAAEDGLWKIAYKRQAVYGRVGLSQQELIAAIREL